LLFSGSGAPRGWRFGVMVSGANLLLAIVLWGQVLSMPPMTAPLISGVLRLTFVPATLMGLVNFLAWIIYRYSATNFRADADSPRFLRWLTLTLFAVQILLLADHLVLFWMAWVAVSLSLHQLLMFYPNRARAILAAHKKFLIGRCSEVMLGLALGLIYSVHHSLSMTAILAQYPLASLPWQLQWAAVLLAMVALLKCAQLPLHGWLIQVEESPTPVSALLHAGVINLGGVLLLLFAPLLGQAVSAQWLILLVAGPSAVLAALIMTTRISIKVRLAWSTCAQMGLMLVECALGLYELALLHLLAHSCYKARAFLSTGSAVREHLHEQLGRTLGFPVIPKVWAWSAALLLVIPLLYGVVTFIDTVFPHGKQVALAPWLALGFALVTFAAYQFSTTQLPTTQRSKSSHALGRGLANLLLVITTIVGLTVMYIGLKILIAHQLNLDIPATSLAADLWVCSLMGLLILSHYLLQSQVHHPQVRRAWIALNAGLYLDEWMTRFTLRWWPVKLTPAAVPTSFIDTEVRS
jgi:NAD(P)H-quinone oxidoreductase subunit 5